MSHPQQPGLQKSARNNLDFWLSNVLRLGQPRSTIIQFAIGGFIGYSGSMTVTESNFMKEAIKQGLRMQHRFLAEPVLARTGKGYMKSEGVTTLQRIKASLKKSKSR